MRDLPWLYTAQMSIPTENMSEEGEHVLDICHSGARKFRSGCAIFGSLELQGWTLQLSWGGGGGDTEDKGDVRFGLQVCPIGIN